MSLQLRQLKPGRQLLLAAVSGLVLALLAFSLLVLPVHRMLAETRARHVALSEDLREARELAQAYAQLDAGADRQGSASLSALVNRSLESQPFQPVRVQAGESGELQLRLENVEFNALLAWLHQLEQTPGLVLSAISVSEAGAGAASVSLTMREN